MRKLALLIAAPLLLLAACSQAGAPTGAPSVGGGATAEFRSAGQSVDAAKGAPGPAGPVAAPAPNQGIPNPAAFNADRNLILTANISMRSKDPWATSDRAQAIAIGLGGDVLGLNQSGKGDNRSATLTMRVPATRFNDALRQLRELDGEVVTSNVAGQDVTDQFVDLQARLAAKQTEEQRYLALLARASTVDEILKVDAALGVVRTQVEQLTGQINSIKSRTEFSTIVFAVTPLDPLTPPDTGKVWDPSKTVGRAIAALAAMFQVFADITIWLVIFGWIPLIALGVALFAVRARRPAAPAA